MFVEYVTRGVKAGVVAGLVFGLFVALVANPMVGYAEAVGHDPGDHAHGATDGHGGDGGVVSLAVTEAVSVVSGVLWAVLLGAVVFGAGFYLLEPILPGSGGTPSYALAAVGFLSVSGAPWLVVPPHPPGVEGSLPVETRLGLYGAMMVAGALVSLLALVAYDRLRADRGRAVAAAAAGLAVAPLAVLAVLAPSTTTDAAVPPALSTGVTGLIVFGQVLLWLLLAAVHARLHGDARSAASSRPDPVAAD